MRYYLDTNILIFIVLRQNENLHHDIRAIISDDANMCYASSIAIQEILFLYRIGKVKSKLYKTEESLLRAIKDEFHIQTVMFNERHLEAYKSLAVHPGHKDMNDHAIIAQSVADRITVISSDHTFREYAPQGLRFVHNRR